MTRKNHPPAPHRIPVRVLNSYREQTELTPPPEPTADEPMTAPSDNLPETPEPGPDWETIAKSQLAEMENFRKRQLRLAEESMAAEKERLLRLILPVADNLTRALSQPSGPETEALRQGIDLTRRELMRWLQAEGVSRILTIGQPFDPLWHEALAVLPGDEPTGTILQEVEAGYKLGARRRRPAKVEGAA
jgi:molecular chaperone GrpE